MDLAHQPLEPDQERLLRALARAYREDHEWPHWRWVRKELGVTTAEGNRLLRSLPRLGRKVGHNGQVYGLVWASDPIDGMGGVHDNTTVGLTAVGLRRAHPFTTPPMRGEWDPADDFLRVLAAAVEVSEQFQPRRTTPDQARFGSAEVAALPGGTPSLGGDDLFELLQREPPFWGFGGCHNPEDGTWHFQLDDNIERYAGIKTVGDYVAEAGKQLDEANVHLDSFFPAPTAPPPVPWWKRAPRWVVAAALVGAAGGISAVTSEGVKAGWALLASWVEHWLN